MEVESDPAPRRRRRKVRKYVFLTNVWCQKMREISWERLAAKVNRSQAYPRREDVGVV